MKAYSLDLRRKIVDIYAAGDISQRKLAKHFGVAPSFVQKIINQYRDLGTIDPKIRTKQTPLKLNPEQLEILRQLVEDQPDATLAELQHRLQQKTDVLISLSTVDRMLRRQLNLTLKKKPPSHPKGDRSSPTRPI